MEQKGQPGKPIPVLIAALVCDVAVEDPSTRKKNLIGIFDRVFARRFPSERALSMYIKLTDAHGTYELAVRYIRSETGEILGEAKGELRASDPLEAADAFITFPPLPIPAEGRYEFLVLADDVYLGSAVIRAVPQPLLVERRGNT